MMLTAQKHAARYARLVAECLDLTPDVNEAIAAADLAMAMSVKSDPSKTSPDNPYGRLCPTCDSPAITSCRCSRADSTCKNGHAWHFCTEHDCVVLGISDHSKSGCSCHTVEGAFAHDVYNRKAQAILNRTVAAAKDLSKDARDALQAALAYDTPQDVQMALSAWLEKYREQLAWLLTTTQLATLLEGMREVANELPAVPLFPTSNRMPATLDFEQVNRIVDRIAPMSELERAAWLYPLPASEQAFLTDVIAAKHQGGAGEQIIPPDLPGAAPDITAAGDTHLVYIEEAARQLAEKNLLSKVEFDRLDAAARAKAWTIAGVDSEQTMERVRGALAEVVREGPDLREFRKKLEKLDVDDLLPDSRWENVFRTTVQTALSDGKMAVLNHPYVRSGFPYARYDAINDDRVRHNHLALEKHGISGSNIYRIEDPVFQTFRPPWDFNCRCGFAPITIRLAAELGVAEAQRWLETGTEPTPPAFVPWPSFRPDPAFQRSLTAEPLVVQLSMLSLRGFYANAV